MSKFKKNLRRQQQMECPPHSLISACILGVCAIIVQALQGSPNALSVSFLFLGCTSVIHHCRLDTWWKRDIWRVLDYVAILLFAFASYTSFCDRIVYWISCCVILTITTLIWTDAVGVFMIPRLNAFMHIIISLGMICATVQRLL